MSLRESAQAIENIDAQLFMASTDDPATNAEFARKNDANFPILSDPNKNTARAYGVLGVSGFASRWTYYIDTVGIVVAIDKHVNPRSAGTDIQENLENLGLREKRSDRQ